MKSSNKQYKSSRRVKSYSRPPRMSLRVRKGLNQYDRARVSILDSPVYLVNSSAVDMNQLQPYHCTFSTTRYALSPRILAYKQLFSEYRVRNITFEFTPNNRSVTNTLNPGCMDVYRLNIRNHDDFKDPATWDVLQAMTSARRISSGYRPFRVTFIPKVQQAREVVGAGPGAEYFDRTFPWMSTGDMFTFPPDVNGPAVYWRLPYYNGLAVNNIAQAYCIRIIAEFEFRTPTNIK